MSLARQVSRDLHPIWERARNARTETWGRKDIEELFGVGRATAQMLMKAIGEIQPVGGAHFVERPSLLSFLDAIVATPSIEEDLRNRVLEAEPPPKPKPLRVSLAGGLRSIMLPDLPPTIRLAPGRLEIEAPTVIAMLESLITLALTIQNDFDPFQDVIEPPHGPSEIQDDELRELFGRLRHDAQ